MVAEPVIQTGWCGCYPDAVAFVVLQIAFTVLSNMTTQQATVLSEIVSNAARAAESAAEAARALREAQERPRNSFSEASKVVKCPEFFGYATADDDQNNWRDFAFSFKAWLVFADAEFDRELALIERASDAQFHCQLTLVLCGELTSCMLSLVVCLNTFEGSQTSY